MPCLSKNIYGASGLKRHARVHTVTNRSFVKYVERCLPTAELLELIGVPTAGNDHLSARSVA